MTDKEKEKIYDELARIDEFQQDVYRYKATIIAWGAGRFFATTEIRLLLDSMQDSSQQCADCVRWDKKKGCILESHNTHCITDAACESYIDSMQASEVSSEVSSEVKPKSKFKACDHIKPIDKCLGSPRIIEEVCDGWYVTDKGTLDFEFEDNWELVEEPAGLDKGKLMDMLEDSLSKETKESWNERFDKDEIIMGKQEFLDKVAALFEEYCQWNGVRETAEWRLTVQYIDGKAIATMP